MPILPFSSPPLGNSGVTPGSYTNSDITVNAKGQVTSASNGSSSGSPLTTKGDIFTYSTADARLPVGTDGQVLSAASSQTTGLQWITPVDGTVTSVGISGANGIGVSGSPITSSGTISLSLGTLTGTTWNGNVIGASYGGAGNISGILKANGSGVVSEAVSDTDYQAPISLTTTGTSGAATFSSNVLNIPQYANTTYSAGTGLTLSGTTFSLTSPVTVSLGGTGKTSLTAYGLLAAGTSSTGALQQVSGTGTAGQVLTSKGSSALPVWQNPSNFSVITTSQTGAVNNGYICNSSSLITVTLPSTAAVGSIIEVAYLGTGGWKIAQAASVSIQFGNKTTTSGTGGSIASSAAGDAIRLLCTTANTGWMVLSSVGNLTVT